MIAAIFLAIITTAVGWYVVRLLNKVAERLDKEE